MESFMSFFLISGKNFYRIVLVLTVGVDSLPARLQ